MMTRLLSAPPNYYANIQNDDDYMNVDGVNVQRIKCDLAHVHLSTVLSMKDDNN